MRSLNSISQSLGMRECETDILTEKPRVVRIDRRCVQQARQLGDVIVRENLGGVLIQEPRRGEYTELFVAIEIEDFADAVQHVATYAAIT